eukprot:sb/3467090/
MLQAYYCTLVECPINLATLRAPQMSPPIIDSHFHMWDLQRFNYPWPNESVAAIHRDVTASEAGREMNGAGVHGAVFVQCLNNSLEEALWVINQQCSFIKGVVAGLNLTDHPVLEGQLDTLCKFPQFVGVRHILDMEEDPAWVVRDDVIAGLKIVATRDKTFDFLARPHHLSHVTTLAKAVPELRIVIDHIAKPLLSRSLEVDPGWRRDMESAAGCPNVHCKISGLVTEVDPEHHSTPFDATTFQAHVDVVLGLFGPGRCMMGSDWPVLTLTGANYSTVLDLHKELLSSLSETERKAVLGGNAASFYKLSM